MPYKTNDELPDGVKSALPAEAQNIWREVFNKTAAENPDDEEAARKSAWGAVKNAGWQKTGDGWVKKKVNAETHEFDIEVMSTGTWAGDEFDTDHLDDMVKNFAALKDIVKPPVKFGHWNKHHVADGQPAIGWVKAVRRMGNKLVATLTDVPDIVYRAIKKRLYRRVSAEVYFGFKHARQTYRRVLAAVGLLGQDVPEVKDLQDLTAFLSQSTPDGGSFERTAAYSFDTDTEGQLIIDEDKGDDEMEKKELEAKLEAEKKAREKAEADSRKYQEERDAGRSAAAADLKKTRIDGLKAFCEDQVKAGKMTPAGRDIIVNNIDKHTYSEEGGFGIPFEIFKEYAETHGKVLDTSEKGETHKSDGGNKGDGSYDSANDEVDARARKYMADHKVVYAEAVKAVLNADDDLAGRYFDEDPVAKDEEDE